jgi:AcrR family transcriptional regulator
LQNAREREREQLRHDIVTAARDLLLEQGLSGLSMRSIADRIEYSPATIYLYFKDKDELVGEVVHTGFELMQAWWRRSCSAGPEASAHRAVRRDGSGVRAVRDWRTRRISGSCSSCRGRPGCASEPTGRRRGNGFERTVEVVGRAMKEGRDAGR